MFIFGGVPIILPIFWAVLLFSQRADASERHPSVAVAVSRDGLEFFSSIGHKIVDHELPKIKFPDITLPIDGGPGSGIVHVHRLKMPKFESPTFQLHLAPPQAINWKSDGGAIKLSGHWKADYTWLATFHLHGWVEVLASGIRSNITLSAFGKDGHPQLEVGDCSVDILTLHLTLGGGVIQWIVNLFKADVSYAVKKAIHKQVCELLRTTILDQANAALRTMPKHMDISSQLWLDYELEQKPVHVSSDHVLGRTYVDVVLGNISCGLASQPLTIGEIDKSYMSNIWIAEVVPNCLLKSAHDSNYLHFILNRNLYSKLDIFLATKCRWYEICIGKFFPKLSQQYPDRHIQMNFYSANSPAISLSAKDGAHVASNFYADWQIQHEDGKQDVNETLARIEMGLVADVLPIIYNQRLCGQVNQTHVNFTQIFSNIGEIGKSFLDTLEMVLNPLIKVAADTTLRLGIPIPLIERIALANRSVLRIEDSAVRCNADFVYVNSSVLF